MSPAWSRPLVLLLRLATRHQTVLWWFHSVYGLLLGIGVMWLGSRHYGYLRIAVFHVAFLWVTSLFAPLLVLRAREGSVWWNRTRLLINYCNRNLYQQVLFFLLPIYYASATWGAANMAFVGLLAASAALSTLDLFYDRHLSVRRSLAALFFAFNLFAAVNVMLPVIWRISPSAALRTSAGLSLLAFMTIGFRVSELHRVRVWAVTTVAALSLVGLIRWGAFVIPPAPLRLESASLGTDFDRDTLSMRASLAELPVDWSGRVYALTAIHAPLGLGDGVSHQWYDDGTRSHASRFYRLEGGRTAGFRLWTFHDVQRVRPATGVRVDVVTESGQLVGRVEVGRARAAGAGD